MKKLQFVVDTSVLIKWFNRVGESDLKQADKLLDGLEQGKLSISVPVLVKYEIGNALYKGKQLEIAEALDALDALYKLPLNFVDIDFDAANSIYEICCKSGMTYYDAVFIGLSLSLECPLISANPKHQNKYPGTRVIPLEKYN